MPRIHRDQNGCSEHYERETANRSAANGHAVKDSIAGNRVERTFKSGFSGTGSDIADVGRPPSLRSLLSAYAAMSSNPAWIAS